MSLDSISHSAIADRERMNGSNDTHVTNDGDRGEATKYRDSGQSAGDDEVYEEDDMSPLQYARFHGLTVDYRLNESHMPMPLPLTPESMRADLLDQKDIDSIDRLVGTGAVAGTHVREKWDVDREAAHFLASVISLMSDDHSNLSVEIDSTYGGSRKLRLEEALLSTDPTAGLLHLKRRNIVQLSTNGLLPFALDETKGEYTSWSAAELRWPATQDHNLAQERLDVDPDTMTYLRECYQPGPIDYDLSAIQRATRVVVGTMTPVLLPLSPTRTPSNIYKFVPELPLTSTPEDLIAIEAASLGFEIAQKDDGPASAAVHENGGIGRCVDEHMADVMNISSSPCPRKRFRDLEAEVPIFPAAESLAKRVKIVSFPECLYELIPIPEVDTDSIPLAQETDTSIVGLLAPMAEPARCSLEEEKLVEADTIMRVPIPEIDPIELRKPWDPVRSIPPRSSVLAEQTDFLLRMKHDYCRKSEKWAGASQVERQLPWTAFPCVLGRVKDEVFDDGSMTRYMAGLSLQNDIEVESLISYQARVENETDDSDYLQPALKVSKSPSPPAPSPAKYGVSENSPDTEIVKSPSVPTMSMQQLIQSRKVKLETENRPEAQHQVINGTRDKVTGAEASTRLLFATGGLRRVTGLSNFLRMHGKRDQEEADLTQAQVLPPKPQKTLDLPTTATGPIESRAMSTGRRTLIPVPTAAKVDHQMSVVISSTLITRRELLRMIQTALPTLDLVERNTYSELPAGPKIVQADANEADITITPSTGLILTTMQKVKQRSLPGQKNFSSVQGRMTSIALRYARLIVLVSEGQQFREDQRAEGNTAMSGHLDDRDTDALTDLMVASTLHGANVEAIYVPGGESQMVMWIVALISRLQRNGTRSKLLPEETMWECLLRQAGLNAFAAQTVLATLKSTEHHGGSDDSKRNTGSFGLASFVRMTAEQRLTRVKAAVGSTHVLDAVSRVIDGKLMKR